MVRHRRPTTGLRSALLCLAAAVVLVAGSCGSGGGGSGGDQAQGDAGGATSDFCVRLRAISTGETSEDEEGPDALASAAQEFRNLAGGAAPDIAPALTTLADTLDRVADLRADGAGTDEARIDAIREEVTTATVADANAAVMDYAMNHCGMPTGEAMGIFGDGAGGLLETAGDTGGSTGDPGSGP